MTKLVMKTSCPGEVLPYKRLTGMCRWMWSHFHDWIDYTDDGVVFSIEKIKWGRTFSVRKFFIFTERTVGES